MNVLWEKFHYIKNDTPFIIDTQLYEYDISKANISVLRDRNMISEQDYQYYLNCDKMEREIAVGKLQGTDPKLSTAIKEGIANARRIFLESNDIPDSRILAIRNDAITIIGMKANNLQITDRVVFRQSGYYTSYYKIGFIEYLYLFDIITQTEKMDVKGLGDEGILLHKNFMLEFLSELFYSAQIEGIAASISLLQMFYHNYIHGLLDIGYYRELNSRSMYKLKASDKTYALNSIYQYDLTNFDKPYLDISFNESILRSLNSIYAYIYFGRKNK